MSGEDFPPLPAKKPPDGAAGPSLLHIACNRDAHTLPLNREAPTMVEPNRESAVSPRRWNKSLAAIVAGEQPPIIPQNRFTGSYKACPRAVIFESEVQKLAQQWQYTVIGKFTKMPPIAVIRSFVEKLALSGKYEVLWYDYKHVLIKCSNEFDKVKVWGKGLWRLSASVIMRMFKYEIDFTAEKESSICPVWIALPQLRPVHYEKSCIFNLARQIGNPLRLDEPTARGTRVSRARVCIEYDVRKPPPKVVCLQVCKDDNPNEKKDFWYPVDFEFIPPYCERCLHLGHSADDCKVFANAPVQKAKDHHEKKDSMGAKNQVGKQVYIRKDKPCVENVVVNSDKASVSANVADISGFANGIDGTGNLATVGNNVIVTVSDSDKDNNGSVFGNAEVKDCENSGLKVVVSGLAADVEIPDLGKEVNNAQGSEFVGLRTDDAKFSDHSNGDNEVHGESVLALKKSGVAGGQSSQQGNSLHDQPRTGTISDLPIRSFNSFAALDSLNSEDQSEGKEKDFSPLAIAQERQNVDFVNSKMALASSDLACDGAEDNVIQGACEQEQQNVTNLMSTPLGNKVSSDLRDDNVCPDAQSASSQNFHSFGPLPNSDPNFNVSQSNTSQKSLGDVLSCHLNMEAELSTSVCDRSEHPNEASVDSRLPEIHQHSIYRSRSIEKEYDHNSPPLLNLGQIF